MFEGSAFRLALRLAECKLHAAVKPFPVHQSYQQKSLQQFPMGNAHRAKCRLYLHVCAPCAQQNRLYHQQKFLCQFRGLEIDIETSVGDINGSVAHKGRIRASTGDISLYVHSPLEIAAMTSVGKIDVRGMVLQRRGVYTPPNATPIGRLNLQTSVGNIKVSYVDQQRS